ncbi:MAG TPA: PemK family transcriptional regulator [Candidatus Taylorbacteria bacterium]|nr:MAG: growth inhibitor protein [Parcubacteria group bacterium GW2011_GWA2_47_64]KKU96807.1 MAG: growth inhibitor protein [Parcubacteria group bacterium GW2011_GWC2_48_17]HBV01342.1 PemK family transcriptional regulator [Candidatus Taylorbacteria bacterium]
MKRNAKTTPKRGEVYIVNFDPTIGSEVKKTRPALILQNDIGNRYSPVTIVAALTSQFDEPVYPTEVLIEPPEGGLEKRSVVLLGHIRTVDKVRLLTKLGSVLPRTMTKVNQAIEISLGLAMFT